MPTRRRTNPRLVPCTWCNAPTTNPCTNAGRTLTWYHQPRIQDAQELAQQPPPPPLARPHTPELPPPLATPQQPTRTRHASCAQWLTHQLQQLGGTAPANHLIHAAQAAGYTRTTLHRTRRRLGITTHQPTHTTPHPGWTWQLTPTPPPHNPNQLPLTPTPERR